MPIASRTRVVLSALAGLALCGAVGLWMATHASTAAGCGGAPIDGAAQTDQEIDAARKQTENAPKDASSYVQLAEAFRQKARDTGDFGFYDRAGAALEQALRLAPDDPDVRFLEAAQHVSYHRFKQALEASLKLLERTPDDPALYGLVIDARIELGDYAGAVEAAQKMVDLRPGTSSYARIAHLRALHGDNEGAVEAFKMALEAAPPGQPETLAWCHTYLAVELITLRRLDEAERELELALRIMPGYHLAYQMLGRARVAAGRYAEAAGFFEQALARVPLPETAIMLGDLYTRLGRDAQAKQMYALVEFIERAGTAEAKTRSLQLAAYWAEHDLRAADALAIARQEREARSDIYTCDTLAWSLYRNGRLEEARDAILEALRLGTQEPKLHFHAGMIHHRLGDTKHAVEHLTRALALNPHFDVLEADPARKTLESLTQRAP